MFDTRVLNQNFESKVVAVTKEIEKTISPDKVTEMYDAVREEAEKNMIQIIRVEGNLINGVALESVDDYQTFQRKIRTYFTLNGKQEHRSEMIKGKEVFTHSDLYEKLKKHYVDVVSDYLMSEAVPFIVSLKR